MLLFITAILFCNNSVAPLSLPSHFKHLLSDSSLSTLSLSRCICVVIKFISSQAFIVSMSVSLGCIMRAASSTGTGVEIGAGTGAGTSVAIGTETETG
jgi:hypothetical protein